MSVEERAVCLSGFVVKLLSLIDPKRGTILAGERSCALTTTWYELTSKLKSMRRTCSRSSSTFATTTTSTCRSSSGTLLTSTLFLWATFHGRFGLAVPRPLADTNWSLTHYRNITTLDQSASTTGTSSTNAAVLLVPVLNGTAVTLSFGNDGSQKSGPFRGSSWCNDYFGRFETVLSDRGLILTNFGRTKRGCLDETKMVQEEAYLDILGRLVTKHLIFGDRLDLVDDEFNLLLRYVPLDIDNHEATESDIDVATSSNGNDVTVEESSDAEKVQQVDPDLVGEMDETLKAVENTFSNLCADVVEATATQQKDGAWTFTATISSPYESETGWDKYADEFQVRAMGGEVLAMRTLAHPHANEQPFTRSLSGAMMSEDILASNTVVVAARDSVEGYCGQTFTLQLQSSSASDQNSQELFSEKVTLASAATSNAASSAVVTLHHVAFIALLVVAWIGQ